MKQFDLQEFLKNPTRPIVTRDGRDVRVICVNRISKDYPVVALIRNKDKEVIECYTKDGKFLENKIYNYDLFFAPEKKSGWINLYKMNSIISPGPDYWTRLEHQYAGMAIQGMSEKFFKDYRDYCAGFGDMDEDEAKATMKDFADAMADVCYYFAHALVEKYKKEERK